MRMPEILRLQPFLDGARVPSRANTACQRVFEICSGRAYMLGRDQRGRWPAQCRLFLSPIFAHFEHIAERVGEMTIVPAISTENARPVGRPGLPVLPMPSLDYTDDVAR